MRRGMWFGSLAVVATLVLVGSSLASDRMLGVRPSDGIVMLVKQFTVSPGTTILGAEFPNNDSTTTFPEVSLVRGPLSAMGEGTVLASVTNVQETAPSVVSVSWSEAVQATGTAPYYLAVRFPDGPSKSGPGVGPAIGADDVAHPNGSFIAGGGEEALLPLRADLAITLLTSGGAAQAGGQSKASQETETPVVYRTFLDGGSPNPARGATQIEYGLEHASEVSLSIYDIAGHEVRRLIQEARTPGVYRADWDGRDNTGALVATGVYIAKFKAAGKVFTQKVVLVR